MRKVKLNLYNSSGTSLLWKRKVQNLEDMGYDVAIINLSPKIKNNTQSLKNKIVNFIAFFIKILRNASAEVDINIVTTNPFFAPFLVSTLSKKSVKNINLVYDLYPEAIISADIIKNNSLIAKGIRFIFRRALENSDLNVFLGGKIESYVKKQYPVKFKSRVIPIGADNISIGLNKPHENRYNERINIVYSGNLGYCHDDQTLLTFFNKHYDDNFNISFYAEGSGYLRFKRDLKNESIKLGNLLNENDWIKMMKMNHISLVSVKESASMAVMPSKLYSSLLFGHAIIAICSNDSDLSYLIDKYDIGWTVEPGDIRGLENIFKLIDNSPKTLLKKRKNAYQIGREKYTMSSISKTWNKVIQDLIEESEKI